MVEERGEPFLLPLPCGFPYTAQRLGHASPALRPVRALLIRVPLGPRPWLHWLRRRSPGFVRQLRCYYTGVRLLWVVHQRLRLLTFPLRTICPRQGPWPIQRSPGSRARSVRTCQGLRPRRVRRALAGNAPGGFAFRQVNNVGTRFLNGFAAQWLAYTLPCRRFADALTDARARLGGDVDCYSFIAVDFHHIPRRFPFPWSPFVGNLPAGSAKLCLAHQNTLM